jgi:hypothetical protein
VLAPVLLCVPAQCRQCLVVIHPSSTPTFFRFNRVEFIQLSLRSFVGAVAPAAEYLARRSNSRRWYDGSLTSP